GLASQTDRAIGARPPLSEEGVDLGDHGRALPDRRAHALHRAGTDVAHGEDPRDPGLHWERRTSGHARVGPRPDASPLVQRHAAAFEPGRGRIGAGEDEEMTDLALLLGPGSTVAPADALQPLVR